MKCLVAGLILGFGAAACGGAEPPAGDRTTGPTATTSPGQPSSGAARLAAAASSSTISLSLRIDPVRSRLVSKPGEFRLVWYDDDQNVLAIGGGALSGTRATSTAGGKTLVLSFSFTEGTSRRSFTSIKGECSVTLAVSADRIQGTMLCSKISPVAGGGGPYRVTASFSAAL